jgi:hypothetical protein
MQADSRSGPRLGQLRGPSCLRLRYSAFATPLSRDGVSGGGPSSASGVTAENGAKVNGAETPCRARQRGHVSLGLTWMGLNPLPHLSHLNIVFSQYSGVPTAALRSGMLNESCPRSSALSNTFRAFRDTGRSRLSTNRKRPSLRRGAIWGYYREERYVSLYMWICGR